MEYYAINRHVYALIHEGKKGMHWGQRLYQNEDGSLTPLGYIHYGYTKRMTNAAAQAVGNLRAKARAAGTSVKKAYTETTKDLDRAKGEGHVAQPTAASKAHTAKVLAQLDADGISARAMRANAAKAKADAAKAYKESVKKAIKQAKKDAKRDAKIAKQDEKWLGKNGEKILKRARSDKTIQKELKAYEKELRSRLNMPKGSESPKMNNALNQREATLLNKYVSIKSPNGTAVTFVAMRRDRGVVAAIGDSTRFRNGVYADGTAAYTKDKAKQI